MFANVKRIDKEGLKTLLQNRHQEEKKLSQIPPPHLLKDATKAAKKVASAIKDGKKITLIGDYDVDGVTSSAIVANFFECIGYPLEVIIPNRFSDGYGINAYILNRVQADLIITVDNGISANEAAAICKTRDIDLIITDHHTPPATLPDAYAIINPKQEDCSYPLSEICGAEVAWLFLAQLKKEMSLDIDMSQFLDLLAIAIIADIMPLIDINRAIVKAGLSYIQRSNTPFATIIRDFLNKKTITSEDIAFMIAPRINSAGRMEDASIALEFFTTKSITRARELFEYLGELNDARKSEEALITKEAIELADDSDDILVVAKEGWHEGIIGIVASKLVDHFLKPAIVLSINKDEAKGSARSLANVDIHKLLEQNAKLLLKFGGHKAAAGLSLKVEDVELFRKNINYLASFLDKDDFVPQVNVVGILPSHEIDFELLEILEYFEPYGEANNRPQFLIQNATISKVELFGKEKNHSKITLKQNIYEAELELLAFKQNIDIPEDRTISCSYRITKNEFNQKHSTQLIINKIYNSNIIK